MSAIHFPPFFSWVKAPCSSVLTTAVFSFPAPRHQVSKGQFSLGLSPLEKGPSPLLFVLVQEASSGPFDEGVQGFFPERKIREVCSTVEKSDLFSFHFLSHAQLAFPFLRARSSMSKRIPLFPSGPGGPVISSPLRRRGSLFSLPTPESFFFFFFHLHVGQAFSQEPSPFFHPGGPCRPFLFPRSTRSRLFPPFGIGLFFRSGPFFPEGAFLSFRSFGTPCSELCRPNLRGISLFFRQAHFSCRN